MKYNNRFKLSLFISVFAAFIFFSSSCDESLKVTEIDETRYETTSDVAGYIMTGEGKRKTALTDFHNEGLVDIYLGLSKEAADNATVSFSYDPSVLKAYKETNKTDYAIYPQESVMLTESVSVAKGHKKSEKGEVKIATNEKVESGKSYVIPIRANVKSGGIKLSEKESGFLLFVKDLTKLPNCDKP